VPIARSGDLPSALARLGFANPTDAARHLEAVALGYEGTVRVAKACSTAADPDLAVAQICRWIAISGRVPSPSSLQRLAAVLGLSTSLGAFLARHPEHAEVVIDARHAAKPRTLKSMADQAARVVGRSDHPMAALRLWKRREMLRIAARDLAGIVPVEEIARELSALAEAAVRAAFASLVREKPGPKGARFAVIAMGKLGGDELNYASDIDLIFVFDGDEAAQKWATKLGEQLIQRLAATTEEGQVFRVDTTLRPEGKDGALVRSLAGYRAYYEKWARPWEFQALLKARAVGGDAALGEEFMSMIEGFVYPERLSPDAVREIRDLKARAEKAIAAKGVASREVKRGPGGIRDIEFAVQLLQLVHGRREPRIRTGNTLEGLAHLAHLAYVGDPDADELAEAYRFLRMVEHRLQLAMERQTHTVPEDERARRRLARAMGFRDTSASTALEQFDALWRETQKIVRRIHEKLFYRPLLERFAQAPALAPDAAQDRLMALGFRQPGRALKFLGDLTAGLSRRAQLMRVLLPVMLDWMSEAPDPDLAVSAFRDVALRIGGNPAALGALRDSPPVVELLCRVLGTSKMLGEYLQHVPEFVGELADPRALAKRSQEHHIHEAEEYVHWRGDANARDTALRRLKRAAVLRIAARDIASVAPVDEVGRELAWLAEGAVRAAVASLETEHPPPPGARFAVIGVGRLGGEELNYGSDVDVLFVYDAPDERAAYEWGNRMGEGLIQRLAATTEEGVVFRVDTALRPEGNAGALVRSLSGYRAYYERWAQTWEFQALIKARPIAGDPTLGQQFVDLVRPFVYPESLPAEKIRDIRSMKARIERERLGAREDPRTQLKIGTGGLIDVEFTIQLLQMQYGSSSPRLRAQSTTAAVAAAADVALIDLEKGRWLVEAHRFLNKVRNRLYLIRGRQTDSLPNDPDELELLARSLGYPSPGARVQFIEDYRRITRRARQVCEDVFYGGRLGGTRAKNVRSIASR
jgi:glutamate-ammonia-ligase adenylyltransferase